MLNLFIGAPQSKYSAMAILAAIIIVSLTLLLGKEPIPLSQKFALVLLIFLISLPGILLTLFQMTCMVTGAGFTSKDSPLGKRWWCSLYAWIVSVVLILYCVFLIVVAVMTLTTGEKVLKDIAIADAENFEVRMKNATSDAVQHFTTQKAEVAPASVAPAEAPKPVKAEEKKNDNVVVTDTFAVAGGASEPAPIEGFEEPEAFSSCGAPF